MPIELASKSDVISIRQHCREISMLLGFDEIEQTSIVTAVTEIVTAMSENAHTGTISFIETEENDRVGMSVLIENIHPDIHDFIKMIHFDSETGETAREVAKTKWLMDDFNITVHEEKGTVITLTKWQSR